MLYIFYGSDSYSRRQALEELKAQMDSDGMLASNTVVLDARQTTPQELMGLCDTVPFLAAHRLAIVESAFGGVKRSTPSGRDRRRRSASPRPSERSEDWQSLVDYIDRMPPTTTLVLMDDDVPTTNPLLVALRPKASAREFRPLRQEDLANWLQSRARSLGLTMTRGAVRLLADLVGNDLWTLAAELDKLAAYALTPQGASQQVIEEEVRVLVSPVREVSIFPLVDAVVEARPAAALKQLRRLYDQGKGSAYIFAMLQRHYRHLVVAREMLDSGATSGQIGERLNLRGYALEKLLEQAPRYPLPRLEAVYQRLLETDVAIKRGIYSDDLALELLVQELATLRPPAASSVGGTGFSLSPPA